jgi:hypothetical protein
VAEVEWDAVSRETELDAPDGLTRDAAVVQAAPHSTDRLAGSSSQVGPERKKESAGSG